MRFGVFNFTLKLRAECAATTIVFRMQILFRYNLNYTSVYCLDRDCVILIACTRICDDDATIKSINSRR